MESKKFCLGEHFTSYDDIKEKNEKVWRGKFWERLDKRFTYNRSCKSKKDYNPAVKFYETRYACKHGGRKFKTESTGERSSR